MPEGEYYSPEQEALRRQESDNPESSWRSPTNQEEQARQAREPHELLAERSDYKPQETGGAEIKESAEIVSETERIRNGRTQTLLFPHEKRLFGKVFDGFRLGGTGEAKEDGTIPAEKRGAEELIVDRAKDDRLRKKIEVFQQLTENLPEEDRAYTIAQRVYRIMGEQLSDEQVESIQQRMISEKPSILLGSMGGKENPGACRQRAPLFQVLASECGLNSSMMYGYGKDNNGTGAHMWNEVQIGNRTLIVDTSNPPRLSDFARMTPEDLKTIGAFPEMVRDQNTGRIIQQRGTALQFEYLNDRGEPLYTS